MATEEKIKQDLRDIIVWMKYAQYRADYERRETFPEIIERVEDMYTRKLPDATWPLRVAFKYVREGKILPSMRAMHFAGEGIERNNARIYNCAATEIETFKDVRDVMFLLLSGCGVGVGVEHVRFTRTADSGQKIVYVVPDSIEGWSESFEILLEAWQEGGTVEFDYSQIRPRGAEIKSINALAPGPEGLQKSHEAVMKLLDKKLSINSALLIRVICLMASAVMSGGVRRSALIGIIRPDDRESIELKQIQGWHEEMPELQYMNISIGWRGMFNPREREFTEFMKDGLTYGEPGFFNFGGPDWLTNPCGEILLRSKQFCNLVEVNATALTEDNLEEIMTAAALLGFVQSRFSDFKFLQPEWKKVTEADRLVGVSLTGIAGMSESIDLDLAAQYVKTTLDVLNEEFGEGVKVPRWTTVKPAGHTSLLMNTSSGIHSYPAPFYLRRITVEKDCVLGRYLSRALPEKLLEQDLYDPSCYKLVVPMKSPEGAVCQTDDREAFKMLDRIQKVSKYWIDADIGTMQNNISATVSVPKDDEDEVIARLYRGTGTQHKGITVLRALEHQFDQPIWEPVREHVYDNYVSIWPMFLSTAVLQEFRNGTSLQGEVACSAGGCEVT